MNLRGGFSLLRFFGITKAKRRISRTTGIPWTRQGRKAKFNPIGWLIK